MSVSKAVADRVVSLPVGSFVRASDFEGSRGAIDTALFRLEESRSDFIRVARGLYWKGIDSRFGSGRPALAEIAAAAAGADTGFGPTKWLATNTLKASTQVPATPEFVVVGSPPERVKNARFGRRSNRNRTHLTFKEIALLEVLRDWPRYGEISWDALVEVIGTLVTDGSIRIEPTANAVATEPSRAARNNFDRLVESISGSVAAAAV